MVAFLFLGSAMVFASLLCLLQPVMQTTGATARRATAVALVTIVPVLAIGLYARLGNVEALTPPPPDPVRVFAEQRTANLASRIASRPASEGEDIASLRLLARSYEELDRFREATAARARLVALQPDDADALVDLADVVSRTQGGSYVGEPISLVLRALAIDANHGRALASAANESAARGDLAAAIAYWERIAAQVPADSDLGRSLRANVDRARIAMDGNGVGSASAAR